VLYVLGVCATSRGQSDMVMPSMPPVAIGTKVRVDLVNADTVYQGVFCLHRMNATLTMWTETVAGKRNIALPTLFAPVESTVYLLEANASFALLAVDALVFVWQSGIAGWEVVMDRPVQFAGQFSTIDISETGVIFTQEGDTVDWVLFD
jgi:hypothetical protein